MQKWKKISSRVILDHPRIKVFEDQVKLPNGKETDYIRFASGSRSATIICKNNSGEILVQKEYSYPPDKFLFQFPGGTVSQDESVENGANRELMEEAKLKANKLTLLGSYYPNCRKSDGITYVYLGTELINEGRQEDTEEVIESYWFNEREIDEMIRMGEIKNISVLAAWSLYKLKK